jgi:hypothetical protein
MAGIDPVDMTIESSGAGWMGTFALTIRFAVDDILSDGAPFPARITWDDEETGGTAVFMVTDTTPTGVVVENRDEPIEYESIKKLEI